jgi:hypothetical protein
MKACNTALILIMLGSSGMLKAQEQPVGPGDNIIDVFYGTPFLYTSVLRNTYAKPGMDHSLRTFGQFGLRVEKMLGEFWGLGLEATYAKTDISYKDSLLRNFAAGVTKYRILARVNYHFLTSSKFDSYLALGAGYAGLTYYQSEPGANKLSTNSYIASLAPVAIRLGYGVRYFFTSYICVSAEIGIGGPLLTAGLSFKIPAYKRITKEMTE